MRFFEDIEIGPRRHLGSVTFTAELNKQSAAQFAPQAFHLAEESGRNPPFGAGKWGV